MLLPLPAAPFDPLLLLLLALAVDAVIGDLPALFRLLPHPVVLFGHLIAVLERLLNRPTLSFKPRALLGSLLVTIVVAVAAGVGWGLELLARAVAFGWLAGLVVAWMLVAQRDLYDHVRAVALALEKEGLVGGRRAVAHIVGRDPERLDQHGVARAAIESCAENFADAVVAPVFWYLLFGLPGLVVYKAANTMDSMIGHRSERYLAFGMTAARLDDALNILPSRLSGLLIALAACFVPHGKPGQALRTMRLDARNHRSPNSGWPEAAMAGALDLALAGPRAYPGYVADEKWIGRGTTKATARDIRRALTVFAVACLLNAGMVILLLWVKLRVA